MQAAATLPHEANFRNSRFPWSLFARLDRRPEIFRHSIALTRDPADLAWSRKPAGSRAVLTAHLGLFEQISLLNRPMPGRSWV